MQVGMRSSRFWKTQVQVKAERGRSVDRHQVQAIQVGAGLAAAKLCKPQRHSSQRFREHSLDGHKGEAVQVDQARVGDGLPRNRGAGAHQQAHKEVVAGLLHLLLCSNAKGGWFLETGRPGSSGNSVSRSYSSPKLQRQNSRPESGGKASSDELTLLAAAAAQAAVQLLSALHASPPGQQEGARQQHIDGSPESRKGEGARDGSEGHCRVVIVAACAGLLPPFFS